MQAMFNASVMIGPNMEIFKHNLTVTKAKLSVKIT